MKAAPNKKTTRILILVIALVLIAGGVTAYLIWGRTPAVPLTRQYAVSAWTATGRTEQPERISYMHYADGSQITTAIDTPDMSVALVPSSGYVYLMAPTEGFDNLCAVFVTDSGRVASTLNYSTLTATYEATGMSAYLDAANYVAYLYLNALDNALPVAKDEREAQWYVFTDDQLKEITAAK